jgi:hypothetical protein
MDSRRGSTAPKTASAEPRYSDIERWSSVHRGQCDGCGQAPEFVLKGEGGRTLTQCADCLTETFRKDPEMTGHVLRKVAERL